LTEIWTGALNDGYRLGGSVGLYDTTLRDGEQTVGVVFDPEQKLEIATLLDDLGIDRIEAGFPRVSQDDWDAVKLMSEAGLRAQIWGFSRAVRADVEALVEPARELELVLRAEHDADGLLAVAQRRVVEADLRVEAVRIVQMAGPERHRKSSG
jgi:isopropylmalate/homocitrate/citramalate synthase